MTDSQIGGWLEKQRDERWIDGKMVVDRWMDIHRWTDRKTDAKGQIFNQIKSDPAKVSKT